MARVRISLEVLAQRELARRRGRRRPKGGGSEPIPVEPDRPKLNEGGAAAALEFDD